MKVNSRLLAFVAAALLAFSGTALFPSETPQDLILTAHGGKSIGSLTRFAVQGNWSDRLGTRPFTLKVDGDACRLELNGEILIRQGRLGQWSSRAKGAAPPRPLLAERREVQLMPLFHLTRLEGSFEYAGLQEKSQVFVRREVEREFIGREPEFSVVSLYFDSDDGSLLAAAFQDAEGQRAETYLEFFDYRSFGAFSLPSRVRRTTDAEVDLELEIVSIDFNPAFSISELDFAGVGQ